MVSVGVVVLTMGDREGDLAVLSESLATHDLDERLVVGNGAELIPPAGWQFISAERNLGVPGGRAFGMAHTDSDVILFLDDDALVQSVDLVQRVRAHFADNSGLGALALRIVATGTDQSLRRWSPRPTKTRSGGVVDVPTFPGGAHALRRSAFLDAGGYVDEFFFKHEETELSWKLIDRGWRIQFDPDAVVSHPATAENRQPSALRHGVRNKTWLARLRLPSPAQWATIAISTTRTLSRCRTKADAGAVIAGLREGLRTLPASREPISWRTMWQLTRLGRPPIL